MARKVQSLRSQELRTLQDEALRMGTNWMEEDFSKPQALVEERLGHGKPGYVPFGDGAFPRALLKPLG